MPFDFTNSFQEGLNLWLAGGRAMIPLALNALLLYGKAAELRFILVRKGFQDRRWQRVSMPAESALEREARDAGVARQYLASRGVFLDEDADIEAMQAAFDELRAAELAPVDRNLKFIKVAMSAAPLWGLLGTVTGMLATFDGLARGGGGDKTMDMVAGGISEALVTTQTGLMVALPGLFFYHYLSRRRGAFEAFLSHLESSYSRHCLMTGRGGPGPSPAPAVVNASHGEADPGLSLGDAVPAA